MPSSAGDDARAAPSASSKGKAMMVDEAAEGVPCGICLTDSRQAVRGELDCCTHHFCFVCIMAWARVETRCPFCKARFRTIRRTPVPGRLPSERVVTVAERIQVWHPLGNESSLVGGTDPSVNSSCSVCSCTNDEDLLLLCELCDVAAHTYCAGLGTTVPEEDWFCKDCATTKEEHSRCQADDSGGSSDQGEFEITIEVPTCAEPVTDISPSGIVDEGHLLSSVRGRNAPSSGPVPVPSTYGNTDEYYGTNLARPTNARSSGPFQVPSIYDDVDEDYGTDTVHVENTQSTGPVPSIYDIVDEDYETHPLRRASVRSARAARESDEFPSQGTSSDESLCLGSPQDRRSGRTLLHAHARFGTERARTLRNSRNLSNRIMELRQNWSALRAGSVGFNRRENSVANSSLNEHRQSKTPSSGHANKISPKDSGHVSKAWKMLEMAKSTGGRKKCNKPSPLDCTPRFSVGNRSTSFSPIDTILGQKNQSLSTEIAQRNTVKYDHGAKKDSALAKKDTEGHRNVLRNCHALVLERTGSFPDRMVNRESPNGKVASSSRSQHVGQKPESLYGSEVASSSRRRQIDPTSESLCDSHGSGKPEMDVPHPFSNSLSSGRSTVTSPLQFVSSAGSQSGTMVNPEESPAVRVTASSGISTVAATVEVRKKSGSDRHGSKRKLRSETSEDQGSKKLRKSSKIAKGEISALAMRELKLLKIDKTHGSDRFKEAARAATHTVLASCGLEHSPELALVLPKPVCKHKPPPEPSVVDDTCKECLRGFVKQAIGSVLSGEQRDQAAASC
uniref:Uncharacterized protein n=1 Tax=Avena sativa TaxID=4498 RepID=A0ACD5VAN5_AVESA